jgi:hypothetical protein
LPGLSLRAHGCLLWGNEEGVGVPDMATGRGRSVEEAANL